MTSSLREHTDPWAEEIVDLETLHRAVTDSIVQEVNQLCTQSQKARPPHTQPARLLLGPPGIGKTHLFTRLRRLVQQRQHRVSLVYIRPSPSAPQTSRMLLGNIYEQLRHNVGERPQIDLLVGAILALLSGGKHRFPNSYLAELESASAEEREERLESAVDQLLEQHPGLESSATYLEALVHIPFRQGRERRAWLGWLEGRESEEATGRRFSLPPALAEDQLLLALRALATVAAPASPLLLVFDQLENLIDGTGHEPRIKAYARLLMEMVDTVPGMVLVQMAVDSDWNSRIEPFIDGAQRSRLSVDAGSPRRALLSVPSEEERKQLVERWRQTLSPPPPQPFPWPFSRPRLAELAKLPGLTPRMLLQYFQEALAVSDDPEATAPPEPPSTEEQASTLSDILHSTWQAHLTLARQRLAEADEQEREVDTSQLLDGLLALGAIAPALRLVRDQDETEVVSQSTGRRVALVHSANGRSTAAQLGRMLDRKLERRPLLALRERWRPLADSWKRVHEHRRELEGKGVLRWSWLEREEAAELLALRSLLMALRSHDVSGPGGAPVDEAAGLGWLRGLGSAPLARLRGWLEGNEAAAPADRAGEPASSSDATPLPPPAAARAEALAGRSPVEAVMGRLRVASIERVVRELGGEGRLRRSDVRRAIERSGGRLRLLGASIVVAAEGEGDVS